MPNQFSNLDEEAAAFADYSDFLRSAKELIARFERLRLPVPATLRRLHVAETPGPEADRIQVSRMPSPATEPAGFKDGWIWVPASDKATQPRTQVLAILRHVGAPIQVALLLSQLSAFRENVNEGSIANVGTALSKAGIIQRDERGWSLLRMDAAPQFASNYLWGPSEVFTPTELAWFRRATIKHVLRALPDGLQAMQIVNHLKNFDWLQASKGKEIVQDDLDALRKEKAIRRVGQSRKWVLSEEATLK